MQDREGGGMSEVSSCREKGGRGIRYFVVGPPLRRILERAASKSKLLSTGGVQSVIGSAPGRRRSGKVPPETLLTFPAFPTPLECDDCTAKRTDNFDLPSLEREENLAERQCGSSENDLADALRHFCYPSGRVLIEEVGGISATEEKDDVGFFTFAIKEAAVDGETGTPRYVWCMVMRRAEVIAVRALVPFLLDTERVLERSGQNTFVETSCKLPIELARAAVNVSSRTQGSQSSVPDYRHLLCEHQS